MTRDTVHGSIQRAIHMLLPQQVRLSQSAGMFAQRRCIAGSARSVSLSARQGELLTAPCDSSEGEKKGDRRERLRMNRARQTHRNGRVLSCPHLQQRVGLAQLLSDFLSQLSPFLGVPLKTCLDSVSRDGLGIHPEENCQSSASAPLS